MKLLINGKQSFDCILNEINMAKESIVIKMFIWRDDYIGNQVLTHLINAAKRGVKITIYKDIYGGIFEYVEETRQSLFHKKIPVFIRMMAFFVGCAYHQKESPKKAIQKPNENMESFLRYDNVEVISKVFKDHTKYYIFDDETLIIGGINIEDKELKKDMQGRHYQDYMVLLKDKNEVMYFLKRLNGNQGYDKTKATEYIINTQDKKEALPIILSLINKEQKKLILSMAYFGNKKVGKALINAKKRGVHIEIVSSLHSNIQPHLNNKMFTQFLKEGIPIYLHPGIVHAKTILTSNALIIGSINLNDASLKKLGECSIYLQSKSLYQEFTQDFNRLKEESIKATKETLKYSKMLAYFEKIAS